MKWLRQYGWRVYDQDSGMGGGGIENAEVPEQGEYTVEQLMADAAELNDDENTPAPEGQPGETDKTPEAAPEGQPAPGAEGAQGKQPYTPEEIQNLDPKQMDPDRVPAEFKPWYDKYMNMQKGFDRKIGELSEQARQPQAPAQQQATDPNEQLLQAYMQDPDSVIAHFDAQFAKAEAEGDVFLQNKLINLKTNLEARANRIRNYESTVSRIVNETEAETLKAIPDWPNQVEKMTDFAVNDLEIPMPLVQILTDPTKVGKESAVVLRKVLHKVMQVMKAGETSQTKINTPATNGETPSPSMGAPAQSEIGKLKAALKDAQAKATKSGSEEDWGKVFEIQSDLADVERAKK